MSVTSVETVRRSFEAFARGEFEAAFAAFSPDVEWLAADDEPDPQTYRGTDGLRDFAAAAAEPWVDRFDDTMQFECFLDDGDWVVAPWAARVQGRGSGIEMDIRETWGARVQEGEIVRVEEYRSRDQALEALGLR